MNWVGLLGGCFAEGSKKKKELVRWAQPPAKQPPPPSASVPNLCFPLPSLTYLHMEIGEGGGDGGGGEERTSFVGGEKESEKERNAPTKLAAPLHLSYPNLKRRTMREGCFAGERGYFLHLRFLSILAAKK